MSLPSDELSYDDTWPYKLAKNNPTLEIVERSMRESSARRLNCDGPGGNGKDALDYFSPNIVITQIGITDAAPRLLKRNGILFRVLNKLPRKISTLVYNFLRRYRGRQLKYCDLTPQQDYEHFDNYCKRAANLGVKVFMIEIAHAMSNVVKVSPNINNCIDIFNDQLYRVASIHSNAEIIKTVEAVDVSDFQSDGIHFSSKGSEKQYNFIKEALSQARII